MANNLYPKPSKKVASLLRNWEKSRKFTSPNNLCCQGGPGPFGDAAGKAGGDACDLYREAKVEGESSQGFDDLYPKQLEEWTLKIDP